MDGVVHVLKEGAKVWEEMEGALGRRAGASKAGQGKLLRLVFYCYC